MYWYVLFVKAGKERKIEQFLSKQLDKEICLPFIPLQEILFRKAGILKREIKLLFPGYVFIESILPSQEFLKKINAIINRYSDIIGLLKYSDTEICMKESEKNMMIKLCNNEHCIEASYGVIEGDTIRVFEGPLKGLESVVKKVNRHKREAQIEIGIMGDVRLVNVALEVVEKIPKDNKYDILA